MLAKPYRLRLLGVCLFCFSALVDTRAAPTSPASFERPPSAPQYVLNARLVAVGLGQVAGLRQVGMFHRGGPIASNPEFLMQTRPGHVLAPERLLVASASNFGAPAADPRLSAGSVLSLDTQASEVLLVPPQFAKKGGQGKAAGGAIQIFSAQNTAFLNSAYNRSAHTANLPGVASPRYISVNNAFGRPWIANSPMGVRGYGSNTVLDPNGRPLDNAPSTDAGGVFAGALSNRKPSPFLHGDLLQAALGTAFLGASPDSSGFAVFAVAKADGSVVQVHVQDGVDGLAPPGTVQASLDGDEGLIGMAFKWNPDRALYIADSARNQIAVLHLVDDAHVFRVARTQYLASPALQQPVDLAAAIPEIGNPRFASHTTLAGGSDLYVLNRGDGSLLRINQEGSVLARATLNIPGIGTVGAHRVRGLAVSADGQRLWISVQGSVPSYPDYPGVVVEVSAFDAAGPYHRDPPPLLAADPTPSDLSKTGAALFAKLFSVQDGLGPLFNARSCLSCHGDPTPGGMSTLQEHFALRVARAHAVTGRQDLLDDANSPIAHRHSLREMGLPNMPAAGIPRAANITSLRMPPALYELAKLDMISDEAILANAVNKGDGIHGRPNRVLGLNGEQRLGRYGWKADIAKLEEMVGFAYANELGISNPLAPMPGLTRDVTALDDDGSAVRAVAAYLHSLHLPPRHKLP